MGLLGAEIANENAPAYVRQSAALALKNQLTAKVRPTPPDSLANGRNKRDETSTRRNGLLSMQTQSHQ
jgi:hypothetical protein